MRPHLALAAMLVLGSSSARAAGLIPGPGETGHDPALTTLAESYDRQFHVFNAAPFGVSLDAFVPIPADQALIASFLAQTAQLDFATFANGRTVDDVIPIRGEYGDLGMFGGMPAAGEAYRYAVLRDSGAPTALVDAARADLLEAISSFAVYADITGNRGTIARGIRRITEAGDPPVPLPGSCVAAGSRTDVLWRSDTSGRNPDWLWMDNTSKDQLLGYVMALGAFWDVIATDPSIPQAVKDGVVQDALDMGTSLMQLVEVRPGTMIDLVIRDANDCLVRFHDLNPRELVVDGGLPVVLAETSANRIAFNALAALGIIRTLYHVTGDSALRTFYYDELVTARGYPAQLTTGAARLRNMFANGCVGNNCVVTNFSNVNMAFVAAYGVLRYETDPTLRATYRAVLESDLWAGPRPHMGSEVRQAFFDFIYVAFRNGGTDVAIASSAAAQLGEWPDPPYLTVDVINCDAGEIAAGTCIAIDGVTTITLDENAARGGQVAAVDALPKRLRVTNNFEWRSDPRVVNGTAGSRLNPGGDFRGTYWLGRYLQSSTNVDANISPIGRNRDGTGGPPIGGGEDAGVPDADPPEDAAVDPDAEANTDAGGRDAQPSDTLESDASIADGAATADSGGGIDAGAVRADDGSSSVASPDEGCSCQETKSHAPGLSSAPILFALWLLIRRRRIATIGGLGRAR